MNLGDELRATLNQEADTQLTPGPSVDRLIAGGRTRRRRRNLTRAGGAALALVLIGGGAYAVMQGGGSEAGSDRIANQESVTPEPGVAAVPTLPEDRGSSGLRPGTFRILVGADAEGAPIAADLTFTGLGWNPGNFPLLGIGESFGGVGAYQPTALAAASGCDGDLVNSNLEGSPYSLAQQLAALPGSTVLQPAESTELLGRHAVHVQVRIPQTCPAPQYYRVAETPRGARGITYDRRDATMPPVVMDFWVMELEGKPLVVDTWYQQGASADHRAPDRADPRLDHLRDRRVAPGRFDPHHISRRLRLSGCSGAPSHTQEEVMQNATRPDVDKLISGGQARKRRRNLTWAVGAAIAVVLIAGGVYAATQLDGSDAGSTATATTPSGTSAPSGVADPPTLSEDGGTLEPGTYRLLVGTDATGATIEADLTVEGPGWDSGNFPVVETGAIYAGLGVYRPSALAAGSGCIGDAPNTDLRQSPRALARQLARLPESTVVQPVTPTEAYGYDAFHLRLRDRRRLPRGPGLPRRGDAAGQSWHQLQQHPRDGRHGLLGPGP